MSNEKEEMKLDDVSINVQDDFPTVDPGAYKAELISVKPEMRQKYESEEEEVVLCFKYQINAELGEVFVFRSVRPGTGDKSNLTKDMNSICKEEYSKARGSEQGVKDLLKSLIGNTYLITVDRITSKKGREYNKFLAVTSMPRGMGVAKKVTDDDIPF